MPNNPKSQVTEQDEGILGRESALRESVRRIVMASHQDAASVKRDLISALNSANKSELYTPNSESGTEDS